MDQRKKWPRGVVPRVARELGCTNHYVWLVLTGRVSSETLLVRRIIKKADDILKELEPAQ